MSRVIAFLACGFTLAACSSSLPSMDFFKSGPATEAVRVESEPPGAEAKTTSGQACRTPCELNVTPGGDLSVILALNGYQPQTVALAGEGGKVTPNPIYAELQKVPPVTTKKHKKVAAKKKKQPTATAAVTAPATTASVATPAPAQAPAPAPAPVAAEPVPAAPASAAYPWSAGR